MRRFVYINDIGITNGRLRQDYLLLFTITVSVR